VRVQNTERCDNFLKFWTDSGCRMLQMSCELHDAHAAGSQFITHTTGRVLSKLGCESTPINTKGFNTLLELIENTDKDSFDLFQGLYKFNPHSQVQLDAFQQAFEDLRCTCTYTYMYI
jgi:arogenate dehydrogenase (NADP+)